jgi:hypothetical protein
VASDGTNRPQIAPLRQQKRQAGVMRAPRPMRTRSPTHISPISLGVKIVIEKYLFVGRLLDAFDPDVSGVSGLQQPAMFR